MKWLHLSILWLTLTFGPTAFATSIYKWTDPNGVVHFSDTPPPENAHHSEELSLPNLQSAAPQPQYGAPSPDQAQLSATATATATATANETRPAAFTQPATETLPSNALPIHSQPVTIHIDNLKNDQTIRSNRGFITVQATLNRKLQIGESLQLLMDAQPYGAPQTQSLWELTNIDRGTHTFSVNLVENGKVIASSKTITVHLHRTTVK